MDSSIDEVLKIVKMVKEFGGTGWVILSLYMLYRVGILVIAQLKCLRRTVIFYLVLKRRQIVALEKLAEKFRGVSEK